MRNNEDSGLGLIVEPNKDFVETGYIKGIAQRALIYLKTDFAVHFRGPAGVGKSTLAKHVASMLQQPICLVYGDEEMTTADLVGRESGYNYKRVKDHFIFNVLKEEENVTRTWIDNQLTWACKYGYTLIYDEFTRSRPEANNVLLSVLQDRLLTLPRRNLEENASPYLQVHSNFKAIFTSNPEEHAGTFKCPDALRDRMITIDISYPDFETETQILQFKSSLPLQSCQLIVDIIRKLRASGKCEFSPTLRSGIMIAKTLAQIDILPETNFDLFTMICKDILASESSRTGDQKHQEAIKSLVEKLVNKNKILNMTEAS